MHVRGEHELAAWGVRKWLVEEKGLGVRSWPIHGMAVWKVSWRETNFVIFRAKKCYTMLVGVDATCISKDAHALRNALLEINISKTQARGRDCKR